MLIPVLALAATAVGISVALPISPWITFSLFGVVAIPMLLFRGVLAVSNAADRVVVPAAKRELKRAMAPKPEAPADWSRADAMIAQAANRRKCG